jgi:nicotinate phosphoribosyltransferase
MTEHWTRREKSMPNAPLITSLLDTDLYKLTMMQAFYHSPKFQGADAEWKFNCRNIHDNGVDLTKILTELERQLGLLCELRFSEDELAYLARLSFLTPDFIDYLRHFQLNPAHIQLRPLTGGDIDLRFKGPLLDVCLFEVYSLAIISELNTFMLQGGFDAQIGRQRLAEKLALLNSDEALKGVKIADFSTRRRASKAWQQEMVEILQSKAPEHLTGTSNLYLAWQLGLTPIGTMAHEWMQAWQAVVELPIAQRAALTGWFSEFGGALGIALTDNYSMDSFCRDLCKALAEAFSGLRHDSGDPFVWGEKAIRLYQEYGIDPRTRTLIFSDSIDFPRAIALYRYFSDRVKLAFGIGTNLGNDVGIKPLNIVIKLVRVNNQPVAKISDEPGKSMCEDKEYLQRVADSYGITLPGERPFG